jgi:hypothetical protein
MADFEVDITPSVTTYELYQIVSYTHWFSLGEFIDNALTSAMQNWHALAAASRQPFSLMVSITLDQDQGRVVVEDNAAGISRQDMARALTAGEAPADASLLSVHGVGMKMSAFWWGRRLTVETWPLGETVGYKAVIDLDEIRERGNSTVHVSEIPGRSSGTRITIDRVADGRWPRGRGLGKLRMLLASMYRLYLNHTEFPLSLTLDGQSLGFAQPALLNEPFWPDAKGPLGSNSILWEAEFDFTTSRGNRIYGFVGLLERMSRDLSGFFLHYKGKGMGGIGGVGEESGAFSVRDLRDSREYYRPPLIFGQEGGYRYQRFTGEFDISDFGKTSSTDAITWGFEEELEFLEALKAFLKRPEMNMWAMAENYQARLAKRRQTVAEQPDASEDDPARLEAEIVKVNEALEESPPHHDEEGEGAVLHFPALPDSGSIVASAGTIVLPDDAGHSHQCSVEYVDDPLHDLLIVTSDSPLMHTIIINIGHPYLRGFQWGNPSVRLAVRSLLLNLALAEVLMGLRVAPDAIRRKLNALVANSPKLEGVLEDV